jgi:hypothetical protein
MGIWSGTVRVDIAVINGQLHGFELKSARDTLQRLPAQAALYSKVFDRVTLVTAPRHQEHAVSAIPDWWGITSAIMRPDGTILLKRIRNPKRNPEVCPLQLARLLWKQEALAVLERHGIDCGIRSGTVDAIAHRLAEKLPVHVLSHDVREVLKHRSDWLGQSVSDM